MHLLLYVGGGEQVSKAATQMVQTAQNNAANAQEGVASGAELSARPAALTEPVGQVTMLVGSSRRGQSGLACLQRPIVQDGHYPEPSDTGHHIIRSKPSRWYGNGLHGKRVVPCRKAFINIAGPFTSTTGLRVGYPATVQKRWWIIVPKGYDRVTPEVEGIDWMYLNGCQVGLFRKCLSENTGAGP